MSELTEQFSFVASQRFQRGPGSVQEMNPRHGPEAGMNPRHGPEAGMEPAPSSEADPILGPGFKLGG